jgi:hypothetical protein
LCSWVAAARARGHIAIGGGAAVGGASACVGDGLRSACTTEARGHRVTTGGVTTDVTGNVVAAVGASWRTVALVAGAGGQRVVGGGCDVVGGIVAPTSVGWRPLVVVGGRRAT